MSNILKAYSASSGLKITSGNPAYSAGIRKAMEFDGTNDYVSLGESKNLSPQGWTVSCWFRCPYTSDFGENTYLNFVGSGSDIGGTIARPFTFLSVKDDLRLSTNGEPEGGGSPTWFYGDTIMTEGKVYFATFVYTSNNEFTFYLNGANDGDHIIEPVNSGDAIMEYIASYTGSIRLFTEFISDLRVYGYTLSQSEIHQLYNGKDIRNDGLVGYWKLDKITNSQTLDETDNNNHGTINGNPSITSLEDKAGRSLITKMYNKGKLQFPYALDFDGTNDYVRGAFSGGNIFSFSAWIKVNNIDFHGFVGYTDADGNRREVYLASNGKLRIFYGNEKYIETVSDSLIIADTWYHIVATYDGTTPKIYIDKEIKSLDYERTTSVQETNFFHIGALLSGLTMDGKIADARIYSRALEEDEIKANMYKRLKGDEQGLVGYWALDEGNGQIAHDKTSNANHGTFQGNPQWVSPFNPEFIGDNCPEFHETLNKKYQACVEKGVTNLITDGQAQQADDTQTDWAQSRTTTKDYDTVFGKNVARHQASDVSSGTFILQSNIFGISGSTAGRTFNISMMIRRESGISKVKLRWIERGGSTNNLSSTSSDFTITEEFQLINFTFTVSQDDRTYVAFRLIAGEAGDVDIVAGLHMPIESAYPVLFAEGTRPAPTVDYDGLLSITGVTYGVVDTIFLDDNTPCGIFRTDDPIGVGTYIRQQHSAGNVGLRLRKYKGTDFGSFDIPDGGSHPEFTRFKFFWAVSDDGSNFRAVAMSEAGNIRDYTSAITPDNTHLGIQLGDNTESSRHEIFGTNEVDLIGMSDSDLKSFIEKSTTGTSIATKASDMTIIQ